MTKLHLALLGWSLLGATTFMGCEGGDVPVIDCATADVRGYSDLADVFAQCTKCHGDRRAESGVRYDTYDDAVRGADQGSKTIANGSMPPDGDLSEADAQAFYAWAQCGTPE